MGADSTTRPGSLSGHLSIISGVLCSVVRLLGQRGQPTPGNHARSLAGPSERDDAFYRLGVTTDWLAAQRVSQEPDRPAHSPGRRRVRNAHRVCAVAGVLDTPTPAFQPGVVLSPECQTGGPRMQRSRLGIATEANSRYRALTRRAYGQTTRDRRCGLGWTAVRCSGPLVGHTANTTRHVAPPGCRYWRPNRSWNSGAKQGWIQLRLHWLRLRYRDAPSLQWWARVLRVQPGHAWRSRGLLEPG